MAQTTAAERALAFVERIIDVRDQETLVSEIHAAVAPFGFDWFVIARLTEPAPHRRPTFRMEAWPPGWYARYTAAGYYDVDPIARHARRTMDPFLWSEVEWNPNDEPAAREMMAEARTFGLRNGLVVPIMIVNGEQEAVSLASDRSAISAEDRRAIQLISIYAHHRACELAPSRPAGSAAQRLRQ